MVAAVSYEAIDHTADFGLRVFGDNPIDLFQNSAMALMDQVVETASLPPQKEIRLSIKGNDWPDLMVNWLREILYLWSGKALLTRSVQIQSITEKSLSSHVWVDLFSPQRHTLISEIKAVTYHQIQVLDRGGLWEATVIFDT
ncbi:MAG: archease [Desulfobacterales bacterium]|nr:archease [Desulfobacterales bacterium]MDX2510479.1 archease [Desulfobacterales bacterium]